MKKRPPYTLPPDMQRLYELAATQVIADPEVAHCWEFVRIGIKTLKIDTFNLGELIEHLQAGNGMMLDELMIEVESPGSDRVLVGILDDQRACSAPKMIAELELLAKRAGEAQPVAPPPKRWWTRR